MVITLLCFICLACFLCASWLQSMGHDYHVHVGRVGPFSRLSPCSAPFTGAHYNPFNVALGLTYKYACSFENPGRCELGDTAGKSGRIPIGGMKFHRWDSDLPLTGQFSGAKISKYLFILKSETPVTLCCGELCIRWWDMHTLPPWGLGLFLCLVQQVQPTPLGHGSQVVTHPGTVNPENLVRTQFLNVMDLRPFACMKFSHSGWQLRTLWLVLSF